MAHLTGPLLFTGSLGGMRAYYNRTLKRYILTTKGGSTREIILNSPKFERTRENMREFAGCTQWSSMLRRLLNPLSHLRKGYYFSAMTSMAKLIQKSDAGNPFGSRSISSSKAARLLPELKFNKVHPFEQVIYLNYQLTRSQDLKQLWLTVPSFRPFLATQWPARIVSWRLVLLTGLLPDLKWSEEYRCYQPAIEGYEKLTRVVYTEWRDATVGSEQIELSTEVPLVEPESLLVVALGVEINTSRTTAVESEGTMKILACFE